MAGNKWMFSKAYPSVEKYLDKYGKYIVRQAKSILKRKAKGSSGRLASSLNHEVMHRNAKFFLVFESDPKYGDFVQQGVMGTGGEVDQGGKGVKKMYQGFRTYLDIDGRRKLSDYKFKKGGKMPPTRVMKDFITSRGIPLKPGQTVDSLAFAMSKAITRKGLPGISFYNQPISATKNLLMNNLTKSFADDTLDGVYVNGFLTPLGKKK